MATSNVNTLFVNRLRKYKHNCKVLKQINSNKAQYQSRFNSILTIATITTSVILTFIGFMSKTGIIQLFHGRMPSPEKGPQLLRDLYQPTDFELMRIEYGFNFIILLLLLLSLIHLIFRPLERAFEYNNSVTALSGFIRDLDDYINFAKYPDEEAKLLLPSINARYKQILDQLPKNSDKDFVRAKRDILKKDIDSRDVEKEDDTKAEIKEEDNA